MKQKVTKDNWEALIHWNFALVGGFLGVYAILLHMGNFGSAQTGNHGNGGIFGIRRVVRCVAAIPCITAFWWRSGGFVHSDEPYEHKYA